MTKKTLTTFEKAMKDVDFKKNFDKQYKEFLLSELILSLMENDGKSVRGLAKEVGLSSTVIQNVRSGKQDDMKLSNFVNISHACGYHLVLEKGDDRINIGE